ncbi:MAG: hypothetical protein O2820_03045 [Planctomycetota bacterium]|nr:hypothetical protein [Planctomycetota bacterium]MDA1248178.1 hypothetical protein [Planctomycetota bacterium]
MTVSANQAGALLEKSAVSGKERLTWLTGIPAETEILPGSAYGKNRLTAKDGGRCEFSILF